MSGWASSEGNKAFHQSVGGSFSYNFRGGNNEHVRLSVEEVCEEEDVRIFSSYDR